MVQYAVYHNWNWGTSYNNDQPCDCQPTWFPIGIMQRWHNVIDQILELGSHTASNN